MDNLWLFDRNNLEKPTNLTASYDPFERSIDNVEFSRDMNSMYIIGHIKLPHSTYTYEPLFARITTSGNRDNRFEQQWQSFLDTSGFSISAVDAVSVLRNGCIMVAFSPYKTENHQVLRLAQNCGDNGFELIGRGEFQTPYKNANFHVKVEKIHELNDGNLLIVLKGWTVIKFNLKNKEIDNDFQENLVHTLRLLAPKEGSSEMNTWGDIRFGTLTPHSWLVFHSHKETPRIIVTDLNGVKLVESENF